MNDEEASALRKKVASLQEQMVALRLQLDQQATADAALMDHAVQRAIDAKLGGRSLTEAERDYVREAAAQSAERKRIRGAILLHILQWGVGGTVGFLLYSAWESVKRKVSQ